MISSVIQINKAPLDKKTDRKKTAGKKEKEDLEKIVMNINNNTDSGIKIKDSLEHSFGLLIKEVDILAGRGNHYDLLIHTYSMNDKSKLISYKVEYKGSYDKKTIKTDLPPWYNGVQFYNGNPKTFTITHRYSREWYDKYITEEYMSQYPEGPYKIPEYNEWLKDAFRQGKNQNAFMIDFIEKYRKINGDKASMLKERTEFNRDLKISEEELQTLKDEISPIYKKVMKDKEYWLQITGDIDHPNNFNVKWTKGMALTVIPELKSVTIKTKTPDIKFCCECDKTCECLNKDVCSCVPFIFEAHLRWGYCAGFANIRLDFK
tara:strand:+ start:257 stop:1213 length:957 start_codon:yes stop_codon:yes gene_type:complete